MSVELIIAVTVGTLVAATLFDLIWKCIFWLTDYPRRSRLDPGFITRITLLERIKRWWFG